MSYTRRADEDAHRNPTTTYGSLAEGASNIVTKPMQEIQREVKESFTFHLFWRDMDRRERTGYHQATLLLGLGQFLLVLAYCITIEFHHSRHIDMRYLNFIVIEVLLAGSAQLVYSSRGICLENSPMLLIANVNSIGLSIRIGLSAMMKLEDRAFDIVFSLAYAILTVMHVAASFVAWGGEFSRFMSFCIGTNEEIQKMFREYQLLSALSAFDVQFSVMATAALLFFVDPQWWHYVLVGILMFLNVACRYAIRRVVREESLTPMWAVIPFDMCYCVFVTVAIFHSSVFGALIEDSCYNTAMFTVIVFGIVRVAKYYALHRCSRNFGHGMLEAFQNQKSATEFLVSMNTTRFRPRFLPVNDDEVDVA